MAFYIDTALPSILSVNVEDAELAGVIDNFRNNRRIKNGLCSLISLYLRRLIVQLPANTWVKRTTVRLASWNFLVLHKSVLDKKVRLNSPFDIYSMFLKMVAFPVGIHAFDEWFRPSFSLLNRGRPPLCITRKHKGRSWLASCMNGAPPAAFNGSEIFIE